MWSSQLWTAGWGEEEAWKVSTTKEVKAPDVSSRCFVCGGFREMSKV